jgi:hypothetical protein
MCISVSDLEPEPGTGGENFITAPLGPKVPAPCGSGSSALVESKQLGTDDHSYSVS